MGTCQTTDTMFQKKNKRTKEKCAQQEIRKKKETEVKNLSPHFRRLYRFKLSLLFFLYNLYDSNILTLVYTLEH